jgi:hypothetical protein
MREQVRSKLPLGYDYLGERGEEHCGAGTGIGSDR